MTTNRLFTVFGLITMLALVTAAVLAASLAIDSLHLPLNTVGGPGQAGGNASVVSAEQARLEFRRGEWFSGRENLYAPLDQHDRHPNVAASEPLALEFQRDLWYTSYASPAALAEQARLDQRRGEWNAGYAASLAEPDVEQARLQWRATK